MSNTLWEIALQLQKVTRLEDAWAIVVKACHVQLQVDRVIICRLAPEAAGVVSESVDAAWASMLGEQLADADTVVTWLAHYEHHPGPEDEIGNHYIFNSIKNRLAQFQVQASLMIPIPVRGEVWGVLMTHQCRSYRSWERLEVHFLQQLALYLGMQVQNFVDRQATETALRQYKQVISATPDCVALIDRNYHYQAINASYIRWNQKSAEQIIGHTVANLLGEEIFLAEVKPRLDRCLAGETMDWQGWFDYAGVGCRFVRATYVPYLDPDGTVSGVVINVHDLTEQKQAETALVKSEELFRQMADNIQEVFWIANIDLTEILYVSPAYEKLWGQDRKILYKQPGAFLEPVHPEDQAKVLEQIHRNRQDGFSHEYRLLLPDGTIRWIWEQAFPVLDALGNPYRVVGISQDITRRKLTEFALQRQNQREQTLNRVFQALRNSLDLETIFATATAETARLLQVERVQIAQYLSDRQIWRIVFSFHNSGLSDTIGLEIPDADNPFSEQLKQGQYVSVEDTARIADDVNRKVAQLLPGAWLLVPLMNQSMIWGSLTINSTRQPLTWSEDQITLVQVVADQLAIAIQQANLYRQTQLELAERNRAEAALKQLNQELEQRVQDRTQALQQQAEQERLLRLITQRIHQSFNLQDIFETGLMAVRQTIHADRVAIYCFNADWSGSFVAESVDSCWQPLVNPTVKKVWEDTYLQQTKGGRYRRHETFVVNDIYTIGHQQCHIDLLEQFQARAYAIAPIFVNGDLWGLLAAYQNSAARDWQSKDIDLLSQTAIQMAIAIQQSNLFQKSQLQVKELERLHQVKDEFLSTVSHELRSPMANIKMAMQMLEIQLAREGVLGAEHSGINRYLEILREQSQREIQLINDLLDLARLDANTEPLCLTRICVSIWVEHLSTAFIERLHQQQQRLELDIPPELELETETDCLERILSELLHNACKYTPAHETIRIWARQLEGSHALHSPGLNLARIVQIRVSNSGVSIPAKECDRIFDKFYRISNNDPWKHGGTGLGLALVKKLTERLEGTVWVESGDRQTTFVLEFQTTI